MIKNDWKINGRISRFINHLLNKMTILYLLFHITNYCIWIAYGYSFNLKCWTYSNMFNNRAGVQKPLFSSNTLCWRLFVCHWICNGQRLHAYTSVIIARATARLYVILFMVMQWPDSVYSRWKEYPDAFFLRERERETLFHPQLSLNPVHSTPLKGSQKYRKQFKMFIYETMQTLLKDGRVPGIFHFPFLFFQTFTKAYISLHELGFGVSFQWIWLVGMDIFNSSTN